MRNLVALMGCSLLVAGCTSAMDRSLDASASVEPTQSVVTYDVAPPNALPLGPVTASVCDGTREVAVRRLLASVSSKGGNGLTQLTCNKEGMSFSCWSSVTCEATALNVPPPPPPPPPVVPRKRVKNTQPKKPAPQRLNQQQLQPWPQQQQQQPRS